MSPALEVHHGTQRVGRLGLLPGRLMAFAYDPDWLQHGRPISCSLPFAEVDEFFPPDLRGHHFFANLLPEGGARARLVRKLGIADDDFLLLEKLGGDCAGALQLLPEGQLPQAATDRCTTLDSNRLQAAISSGQGQWLGQEEPPRLSLAGAQDKLALRAQRQDDGWTFLLPEAGAASTHILKLPVSDLPHVPLYEACTSFLAAQLELPVAAVELVPLGDFLLSLSERFDRRVEAGAVLRVQQEDLCQAQGLSHAEKYVALPGMFTRLADLLREHSVQPAQDIRALVMWQVFNALAGNTDGHLKNLSLLAVEGGGWRLAPFYDLVCTLAIEQINHRLALPVGDKNDPQNLSRNHWEGFAQELGVAPRLVQRIIREQAQALHENADTWFADFQERYGELPALARVQAVVRKQCRKALRDWV